MTLHILLVDPDASAAQVTSALVQRLEPRAEIVCEGTPEAAWLRSQQQPFDILIVDPLPQSSLGPLLIQLVREQSPACRIVVLSSAPTPALRRKMNELNVDVYLEKSAALPVLKERLQTIFAQFGGSVPPLGSRQAA